MHNSCHRQRLRCKDSLHENMHNIPLCIFSNIGCSLCLLLQCRICCTLWNHQCSSRVCQSVRGYVLEDQMSRCVCVCVCVCVLCVCEASHCCLQPCTICWLTDPTVMPTYISNIFFSSVSSACIGCFVSRCIVEESSGSTDFYPAVSARQGRQTDRHIVLKSWLHGGWWLRSCWCLCACACDGLYVFLSGNKGMASGASSLTVSSYITALASTVVAFVLVMVAWMHVS